MKTKAARNTQYQMWVLVGLLCISMIIWIKISSHYFKNTITLQPSFTSCTILKIDHGFKRGYTIYYEFTADKKKYSEQETYGDIGSLQSILINKQIPVIYSSKNPDKYQKLLLFPDDFKEFNIPFPDSLRWVLE